MTSYSAPNKPVEDNGCSAFADCMFSNFLRFSVPVGAALTAAVHPMIRIAKLDDLPAIVRIYNDAVASRYATADTTAVTIDARREWFVQHEPTTHPIFVFDAAGEVKGWCALSPYRQGRLALRFTAEISYYVQTRSHRNGIGSRLIEHALAACHSLQIKNVFAIVLERNAASRCLLGKLAFEQWGFMPRVADFDGQECGHVYYGRRIS